MKVVCGLGNPGSKYDATRHNVGWWLLDRLCADMRLGPFQRESVALEARGRVGTETVLLLKPLTYMNRSGDALAGLGADFDFGGDLLVVVDDAALETGRVRFRARGSAGGHNGLKSIESAIGTRNYARLRIGIGMPPNGTDMVDWVLSPFARDEEEKILEVLPAAADGVRVWLDEGIEAAMNRYNAQN